jgi:putative molybdopterin biosynthesis protein
VEKGQIIEFNSIMLAAQVNQWGGIARKYEIIKDSLEDIQSVVSRAAKENDLILLLAGSSAGSEDFSAQVVETLGKLFVHGVAVRPGHPVILGTVEDINTNSSTPIVGVPGYPVSAVLTGEIFIEPIISKWLGCQPAKPDVVKAKLTRKVTSPPGDDDYMRVVVAEVGEQVLAAPLSKGSGVITSLVKADGIVIIPSGVQGFEANAEVDVRLYNPTGQLKKTILAIGSHDMVLDLASQYLAEFDRRIVSSNVGSLAGLIALSRGEAHLAGSHLLDPETGTYNLAYVKQYLPGVATTLVEFVRRQQGLIVAKCNPKRIYSINDFNRSDILIVNRQRGAGTRVLLDYQLSLAGINKDDVNGYQFEEYTHLAVAVAVSSGRADVGLGIAAAAQALDLDFVPLVDEEYDLVIPSRYYDSHLFEPLLDMIHDNQFREMVSKIPGYNSSRMGVIKSELE